MKAVTWIIQILVSLAFLVSASFRMFTPYEDLITQEGLEWATDFSATQIKLIAGLEILAVIGLNLPILLNKFKFFVPLAAIGLVLTMIGAMITHINRGEPIVLNIVLLVLAGVLAYLRRGYFSGK